MKALLLALTCLLAALPQEPKKAADLPNPNLTIEYDRFADATTVAVVIRLQIGRIKYLGGRAVISAPNPKFDAVRFHVLAVVPGENLSTAVPVSASIAISSKSKDWVFLTSGTDLRVIMDGKDRLLIGEMKRSGGEVLNTGRGVIEQLTLGVPFSLVERLSKAVKLEMQVGFDEFEFTPSQLADLRQWVRQFPAAESKPAAPVPIPVDRPTKSTTKRRKS